MPTLHPYDRQVQQQGFLDVKASANEFGGLSADAVKNAGVATGEVADTVNRVDEQKARMRAGADLAQRDMTWRKQLIAMQNDPEFAQKYGEDGSGFATAFKDQFEQDANGAIQESDPRQRRYMQQGMYNLGESLYGSAMDFQAKVGADFAVNTVTKAVDNARQSANMAPEQYMSIMANANMVIDQAQNIDPMQRLKLKDAAAQDVTLGAAMGMMDKHGAGAAAQLKAGKMVFTTLDDDGKPVQKNLRDIVDEKTYGVLTDQADRIIKEAQSAQKQLVDDNISDVKTALAFAETPDDFVSIAKSIEGDKSFSHVQRNELMVAWKEKSKKVTDEIDSVSRGSNYATGAQYLNPSDDTAKKDFNLYYNRTVEPTLQDMPPEEKNTRLADLVSVAKVVPDNLKGDMHSAARSLDPNVVADKADFLDRLSAKNSYMLKDFDPADTARVQMVNNLIGAGYNKDEAFKRVDDALNPANKSVQDGRADDIKNFKLDYKSYAMSQFEGYITKGFDTSGDAPTRQIAQMTSDYKMAFDTQYKLTGDKSQAISYANTVIAGQYGKTTINGSAQMMKYPPEKAYGIDGLSQIENTQWMRDQVLEEARKRLSDSILPPGVTAEKNVILTPDPMYTSRGYKTGRPGYRMMLKQENGELTDLLGVDKATGRPNLFYFDPGVKKQDLLDKALHPDPNTPIAGEYGL